MIEVQKDVALHEIVARLRSEWAVGISRSVLNRWLRQHGWTFKKNPHALEQKRADVLKRRQE
ncbi:hypothetical protein [Acetobacter persici]